MVRKKQRKRAVWLAKRVVHYILLGIYKVTYGLYISKRYRLKLSPDSKFSNKGPYLLLANHCNSFDGLFLQCLLSKPIHFVVTDTVFKNRALGGLMSLVGYIPKKKFVSDTRAIRQIMRTTHNGGIVGIFPEGRRSWDGQTVHITSATYKLIKMLKVPVVTAVIKGAYLSEPRWSNTKRWGVVEVKMNTLLSADDLAHMSLPEIEKAIETALDHNEFAWQDTRHIAYKGKGLAEGFERLLFTCPECKNIGTMDSHDDRVWCTSCGAEYYLDEYGYIHSKNGHLPSMNIVDLNRWQRERLKQSLSRLKENEEILLSDEDACLLSTSSIKEPFREMAKGQLSLSLTKLSIGSIQFDLNELYGISVNFKSHLSFRHKSRDYRVGFRDKRVSIYKWYTALDFVTGGIKEAY